MEENAEITAEQQEQQPLYQATVEDDTESTAEKQSQHQHGSDKPDNMSTLPTIPRLCTSSFSGDPTACLSNAFLLAWQHATFLAFRLSYIRCQEGMEATGQG